MSMFLELSSRMIDYLPEEVSKIQRTIEVALAESNSEAEMFARVDTQLTTNHLREGAREFWDVWSNASDYAEPLTEGFGGFPIDKANVVKNRGKDRNIGRVFDINGQQVLVVNKRSNGDYVLIGKDGRRMARKGDAIGATRTEKVELNLLDVIEEEDQSASESPNGTKKKAGKTTVIINPKSSDLMREEKKEEKEKKGKKAPRWQDSDGDGKWYEPGQDVKVKKEEVELGEKIDVGADAGKTIRDFVHSKAKTFKGDTKKQRINRALGAYYGAQKEEFEIDEAIDPKGAARQDAAKPKKKIDVFAYDRKIGRKDIPPAPQNEETDPCWKGYKQIGMKDKGGRQVPNCVPKEEYQDLVGELVSEGYEDEQVREILEAIEDGFEVIFEENGYSVIAEETLDEEAQFFEEVEMVADWLHAEGIIHDEDDFFALMEDLSEEEIEELYDVVLSEAEGSYGQTPKARSAMGKLAVSRMRKPASEYSQKGEKTRKVKAAEKHTRRQDRLASGNNRYGSRGPMDQARRNWSRGADEYGHTGYDGEGHGGSVTKNPKKLRKQKAMGEIAKEQFEIDEATAMAKRGYDETKLRQRAGGGEAADRATSLEDRPTYGDANKAKQRQNYARAQRGDFRKTASSNPGLHGYAHKSDDPKVKAKQAARGAQRGALTPNEKKNLNMGYEMIGDSLEEGGMQVRTYSWREVLGMETGENS